MDLLSYTDLRELLELRVSSSTYIENCSELALGQLDLCERMGVDFYKNGKFLEHEGMIYEALQGMYWVNPLMSSGATNLFIPNLPRVIDQVPQLSEFIKANLTDWDGLELPAVRGNINSMVPPISERAYVHNSLIVAFDQTAHPVDRYARWIDSLTAKRRYKVKDAVKTADRFRIAFTPTRKLPQALLVRGLEKLKEKWGEFDFTQNAHSMLFPQAVANFDERMALWVVARCDDDVAFIAGGHISHDMLTFNVFVDFQGIPGSGTMALHEFVKHACNLGLPYMNSTASTNPDYDEGEPSYVYKHSVCNAEYPERFYTIYGDLPGCELRIPCYDADEGTWTK